MCDRPAAISASTLRATMAAPPSGTRSLLRPIRRDRPAASTMAVTRGARAASGAAAADVPLADVPLADVLLAGATPAEAILGLRGCGRLGVSISSPPLPLRLMSV